MNTNTMKIFFLLIAASLSVVLVGCSEEVDEPAMMQIAMSSTTLKAFTIDDFTHYQIEAVYPAKIDENSSLKNRDEVYQYIAEWLDQNMQDQGLQRGAVEGASVLTLRFGLANNVELSDETLIQRFGISPGLAVKDGQEKVTLGVALRTGDKVLRKSAAQGVPNSDLSDDVRKERLEHVLVQLLGALG